MGDEEEDVPPSAFSERKGSVDGGTTGLTEEFNPFNYEHLDSMNTEFIYYSTTLKAIAPTLSSIEDRAKLVPWIKKLFGPEYQAMFFRKKRNKYLLHLTLKILRDEVDGAFTNPPPCGALPNVEDMAPQARLPAKWEYDTTWERLLEGLPDEKGCMPCCVHNKDCSHEARDEASVLPSALLDLEFKFFLYLARPYAALIVVAEDKAKVASWLQTLATIRPTACLAMKGIRNDYMQNLLGYIQDLRATGPFQEYPPSVLMPLQEAAKYYAIRHPFVDPSSKEANDFLISQPIPENGAICYVAVSGDLTDTNLVSTKPEEST